MGENASGFYGTFDEAGRKDLTPTGDYFLQRVCGVDTRDTGYVFPLMILPD